MESNWKRQWTNKWIKIVMRRNSVHVCSLHAGVEVVCVGIVVPRQSECCTTERADHDQTTCVFEFGQHILLDNSSYLGDTFNKHILYFTATTLSLFLFFCWSLFALLYTVYKQCKMIMDNIFSLSYFVCYVFCCLDANKDVWYFEKMVRNEKSANEEKIRGR